MDKTAGNSALKRLKNHYRLVIMNEDTYEEVIKFKLTRTSVYIMLSSIFILMIGITASLIIFTPLKYYLPNTGYGNVKELREYRQLKMRTDSMEQALQQQDKYLGNIQKILSGNVVMQDTNKLVLPKSEIDLK